MDALGDVSVLTDRLDWFLGRTCFFELERPNRNRWDVESDTGVNREDVRQHNAERLLHACFKVHFP